VYFDTIFPDIFYCLRNKKTLYLVNEVPASREGNYLPSPIVIYSKLLPSFDYAQYPGTTKHKTQNPALPAARAAQGFVSSIIHCAHLPTGLHSVLLNVQLYLIGTNG
jgi:hypothetical protein